MDTANTDVVVVGAGPSGLVAALELVRHGVRVRIIDRKPGPVEQSRATIVHARTLEVLDRFEVADQALERGVPIIRVEVHDKGRAAALLPLADPGLEGRTRFPCALSLEQSETERILVSALGAHGVAVEWGSSLEHLVSTSGAVEAVVRRGERTETVTATWLVAADGASSSVRRACGIPFVGTTYPQTGLLADVALDVDLPTNQIRLNLTRGGFVGILPLGPGRHRLFGAVPPGYAPASDGTSISHESYSDLARDQLQAWFDGYFQAAGTLREVSWASLFRFHSRIAARYRSGNVFLVGDAAHIHNPAGGQGLNLGVGDAANLGWKLAAVIRGEAQAALLDTYETERRPVARTIMRNTDRGFRLETTANPLAIWLRLHLAAKLIGVLTRLPAMRRTMFRMLSQTWIGYRNSPAVTAGRFSGALRPGDRAPHAPIAATGGSVLDVLRTPGFHLLVFEGLRPDATSAAPVDSGLDRGCLAPVHAHFVPRSEQAAHLTYGADQPRAVLIRPDGHLAAIGSHAGLAVGGRLASQLNPLLAEGRK